LTWPVLSAASKAPSGHGVRCYNLSPDERGAFAERSSATVGLSKRPREEPDKASAKQKRPSFTAGPL